MLTDVTNCSKSGKRYVQSGSQKYQQHRAPPQYAPTPAIISPSEALIEIEAINQRIRMLIQGMTAWMSSSSPQQANPVAEEVRTKVSENEKLLGDCRVLHQLQQQLTHWKQQPAAEEEVPCPPPTYQQGDRDEHADMMDEDQIFAPPRQQQPQQGGGHPHRSLHNNNNHPGNSGPVVTANGRQPRNYRSAWPPTEDCDIVIVEFKRQRMKRCISDIEMEPGRYVIIPGDRGYDCGLVVQCGRWSCASESFIEGTLITMDNEPIAVSRLKGDLGVVTREASPEEINQLYVDQASKERLALKTCRDLVEKLMLDMEVVDCEYQFDGTKISFYFEATRSIDFRDLNKELYRIFNARIWLENVNNSVKNVVPDGAMSRGDKLQYQRSGLRLPNHY